MIQTSVHIVRVKSARQYGTEPAAQYDPDHSESEDRFLLLGRSARMRLVIVSHTHRAEETVIRIISARKATKQKQRHYTAYLR